MPRPVEAAQPLKAGAAALAATLLLVGRAARPPPAEYWDRCFQDGLAV